MGGYRDFHRYSGTWLSYVTDLLSLRLRGGERCRSGAEIGLLSLRLSVSQGA